MRIAPARPSANPLSSRIGVARPRRFAFHSLLRRCLIYRRCLRVRSLLALDDRAVGLGLRSAPSRRWLPSAAVRSVRPSRRSCTHGSRRRLPDGCGFQVLLTAYPEVQSLLDLPALQLSSFWSGARLRLAGRFVDFLDPIRRDALFRALPASRWRAPSSWKRSKRVDSETYPPGACEMDWRCAPRR